MKTSPRIQMGPIGGGMSIPMKPLHWWKSNLWFVATHESHNWKHWQRQSGLKAQLTKGIEFLTHPEFKYFGDYIYSLEDGCFLSIPRKPKMDGNNRQDKNFRNHNLHNYHQIFTTPLAIWWFIQNRTWKADCFAELRHLHGVPEKHNSHWVIIVI